MSIILYYVIFQLIETQMIVTSLRREVALSCPDVSRKTSGDVSHWCVFNAQSCVFRPFHKILEFHSPKLKHKHLHVTITHKYDVVKMLQVASTAQTVMRPR